MIPQISVNMDLTLEEGREALNQLSRFLESNDNYSTGSSSRQTSRSSERRMLDQAPRDLRLHNRLGSPIGSLVELDDRGFLEGGGSGYSSQQRSRRSLEMKKRSSRLKEREKEVIHEVSITKIE
jgi:hypothetical protein